MAEDNSVNRHLVARLLEKRGHAVVISTDGREAITAWQNQTLDLILMDVQMPLLSGVDPPNTSAARNSKPAPTSPSSPSPPTP